MEYLLNHIFSFEAHMLAMVPAAIAIIWGVTVKAYDKKWHDLFFITFTALVLVSNCIIVSAGIHGLNVPNWLGLVNMVSTCAIVPMTYSFFANQVGRAWNNLTTIWMWALLLLLLVPNIAIDLGQSEVLGEPHMHDAVRMNYIRIFRNGEYVYEMSIASLIILVQALLSLLRVWPLRQTLKQYDLHLSSSARFFFMWWLLAFAFIVFTSALSMDMLRMRLWAWVYYAGYAICVTTIYVSFARRFDLHPVVSDDEQEVELDSYINAHKELAEHARRLFAEQQLYKQPGIVIDDVVSMLGTNRTYFTRMMRAEFGMSFTEYMNNERIIYAKRKLLTSDATIEEIAEKSGFNDAPSFCRVFKRITNTSPDVWRRQNKVEEDEN